MPELRLVGSWICGGSGGFCIGDEDMAHAKGFKPPQIREKLVKVGATVVRHAISLFSLPRLARSSSDWPALHRNKFLSALESTSIQEWDLEAWGAGSRSPLDYAE